MPGELSLLPMSVAAKKTKTPQKVRDHVEGIYIAIVLAFVLRAFLLEAFVIPTGSMANALYGEHLSLVCPACQIDYTYGLDRRKDESRSDGKWVPRGAVCPNCTLPYDQAAGEPGPPAMARGGDRVVVLKYFYGLRPPQPWDVMVFKNPQNNRENYIKRLIGLPGETIEILNGDIFVHRPDDHPWAVRRKTDAAQKAMWQLLYDQDYRPNQEMMEYGKIDFPHWQPASETSRWTMENRAVTVKPGPAPAVLQYVPGERNFRPYNSYNRSQQQIDVQTDICTDWRLAMVLWAEASSQDKGELTLTFERFDDRFRGRFACNGTITMLHQKRDADPNDPAAWSVWGETHVDPFTPEQGRKIAMQHVDYQLTISVDDQPVLVSSDTDYPGNYEIAQLRASLPYVPTDSDLQKQKEWFETPGIAIAASGPGAKLNHIQLHRDTYYTCPSLQRMWREATIGQGVQYDYARQMQQDTSGAPNRWMQDSVGAFRGWATTGNPLALRQFPEDPSRNEYFCLGDNSPESLDGRGWSAAAPSLRLYDADGNRQYQLGTVPRYNIIGRAMLVYWPSGFPVGLLPGKLGELPVIPNAGRMRWVR
jgi:signal peptidase I